MILIAIGLSSQCAARLARAAAASSRSTGTVLSQPMHASVIDCPNASCIDGDLDATLGAVLETDRHGEPRGELAVDLALRRSRPDRSPGDQVGDELRRDRVEELASGRQSEADQIEQQAAGEP